MKKDDKKDLLEVRPYDAETNKTEQIRAMFDNIAREYDLLNRLISLGLDKRWRRRVVNILSTYEPTELIDVASGTGDLAFDMLKHLPSLKKVRAVDLSREMLQIAEYKAKEKDCLDRIEFDVLDATSLPFEANTFDAATIAFGIRNFTDIPKALAELHRVLKETKPLIILELSEPKNRLLYQGYLLHTSTILPLLGGIISGDSKAYRYLPKSIASAPQRKAMVALIQEAGFRDCFYRSFRLGVCTLYMGVK